MVVLRIEKPTLLLLFWPDVGGRGFWSVRKPRLGKPILLLSSEKPISLLNSENRSSQAHFVREWRGNWLESKPKANDGVLHLCKCPPGICPFFIPVNLSTAVLDTLKLVLIFKNLFAFPFLFVIMIMRGCGAVMWRLLINRMPMFTKTWIRLNTKILRNTVCEVVRVYVLWLMRTAMTTFIIWER